MGAERRFKVITARFTGKRLRPSRLGWTDSALLNGEDTAIPAVKTYLLQMREYLDGLP